MATNLAFQGQYARAEPLFEKALAIFRSVLTDGHPRTASCYSASAYNLASQGKYELARDRYQRRVNSLDKARLLSAFSGLDRAGDVKSARSALAAVHARLGQPVEAWRVLEEDLGRGLLDELNARQDRWLAPAARDRLHELTIELERLDRVMESAPRDLDQLKRANQVEDLKHRYELASIALGEFQSELIKNHGPKAGQAAGLGEIQAVLPPDAALVTWVDIPPMGPNAADSDGEHWGVVVRSRGVPSWVAIAGTDPDSLWTTDDTDLATRVRTELRKKPDRGPEDLRRLIEKLRAQRLEPLATALAASSDGLPAAQTLIVLPSHEMAGIPVEALLADDDKRKVSYAPSATVFKYLRDQPRPDLQAGLLALGDPDYARPEKPEDHPVPDHGLLVNLILPASNADTHGLKPGDVLLSYNGTVLHKREDLKAVPEPGQPVPVDYWRNRKVDRLELAPGKLGVVVDSQQAPVAILEERKLRQMLSTARSGGEEFSRLRWTRDEVEKLAKLFRFNDRPARILLGAEASEIKLDQLAGSGELERFGVIHLASHAVIDDAVPARSAVILTQTGLPDPLQQAMENKLVFDGRLSVREIQRGWKLNAELVTLSACETALGRDGGGEGFVGFTQALLISGARSVCLSLWKVDDRATSLLMKRFYENWLGKREGLTKPFAKAEALREAKQWLRGLTADEVDREIVELSRSGEKRTKTKSAPTKAAHPFEHPYYWAGFILVGDPS